MSKSVTMLTYAACGTCKKAQKWLESKGISVQTRPIVEAPPTAAELSRWIPQSGLPVRKWLNTSGQSYRALGKEAVAAASEDTLVEWLARDGKLVKRPVIVTDSQVLVGFHEETFAKVLAP